MIPLFAFRNCYTEKNEYPRGTHTTYSRYFIPGQPIYLVISFIRFAVRALHFNWYIAVMPTRYSSNHTNIVLTSVLFFQYSI